MYLMYVDESGDPGIKPSSPTKYFILSGIVVHELHWRQFINEHLKFRQYLRERERYKLKLREEIHCSELLSKPGKLARISRNDRLAIIRQSIDWLSQQLYINIISVCVKKSGRPNDDVFEYAWQTLLQRFENTIQHKNFPGSVNNIDKGIVFPDNTDGKKLTSLIRKMRYYNYVPSKFGGSRNLPIDFIVEDPNLKDSANSFYHQMCDVVAYCAKQKFESSSYMKKKAGHLYYGRLHPVLMQKASTPSTHWIITL